MNSIDRYFNIGLGLHDLKTVYDECDKYSRQYINICVNIAYLFVNGLYDIRKVCEVNKIFQDYDNLFSNKYAFNAIILTDCSNNFGDKQYTPELIGYGKMWKDNDEALYNLINQCQNRNISILTSNNLSDIDLIRIMSEELFS